MPWHVSAEGAVEGCAGYAVVKDDDDSVAGCHATQDEAEAQMAALYAEEEASLESLAAAPTTTPPAEFHGPLAFEDQPTGDGRLFMPGSLRWREPPLPLMWQIEAWEGHSGAVQVGVLDRLVKRGPVVWGYGTFDLGSEEGREAARRLDEGYLRGNSVDIDSDADVEVVMPEPEDEEDVAALFAMPEEVRFHDAAIMGTTLVAFPAFAGAHLRSGPGNPDAEEEVDSPTVVMTASGEVGLLLGGSIVPATLVRMSGDRFTVDLVPPLAPPGQSYEEFVGAPPFPPKAKEDEEAPEEPEEEEKPSGDALVALLEEALEAAKKAAKAGEAAVLPAALEDTLVASGLPHLLAPPPEWFSPPVLSAPTHLTVDDDGRVYGHLALWDSCHTSFGDRCIRAPRSSTSYAYFRSGEVLCADGSRIATGAITLDTDHAHISLAASPAKAHYDHTGAAVADVAAGEDAFGIWLAGSMRPTASPESVRALRAADVSGDWRGIPGIGSELVAVLAVNVPGFPIPRVHSRHKGDRLTALVAGAALFTPESEREAIAASIGRDPSTRRAELAALVHA